MNETSANPIQNTAIPPIDAITTPPVINELPRKRNYPPWFFGILILVVIFATFFLILTGKSLAKEPAQVVYNFYDAMQRNDLEAVNAMTNKKVYAKTLDSSDSQFLEFRKQGDKFLIYKTEKLGADDYVVYYKFDSLRTITSGTVRVQKINNIWMIVNAPACDLNSC